MNTVPLILTGVAFVGSVAFTYIEHPISWLIGLLIGVGLVVAINHLSLTPSQHSYAVVGTIVAAVVGFTFGAVPRLRKASKRRNSPKQS